MFVAEVGSKADMERILAGTPWMVGRHAVVLKPYDERLSADEIIFDRMEIWVRILKLPLGWMNQQRGTRSMSLIGHVVKMDVDGDGKASGAFLRARVAIELDKPLRRGVLLRMSKMEEPKWFEAHYERLPYYCFSCGLMCHSKIDCPHPAPRNEFGKLPYDVPLRDQRNVGEEYSPSRELQLSPLVAAPQRTGHPTIIVVLVLTDRL